MSLVIKRKISLAFLGEEYEESYIIVKAIGVAEYDNDNLKGTVKDEVINRFIEGEIAQDEGMAKITKENISELPGDVFVKAFEAMTSGPSPKALGQSIAPSTITPQPPTN